MASKRFVVCTGRESNGKTYWQKIGTLWQNDDGKMSISFDALPTPSLNPKTGQVETRAMVFEPNPRDGGGSGGSRSKGGGYDDKDYGGATDDSDIPFVSCANITIGVGKGIDRI